MMKPKVNEHPGYYTRYIDLVKQENLSVAISETTNKVLSLIQNLNPDLGDYAYEQGKWSLKEVLIHCMDTERIFSTRALCFARGEQQSALSFDENVYAPNCEAHLRSLQSIHDEYKSIGAATLALFDSFSEKALATVGNTPSGPSTVNAIGFAICGHTLHHLNVITERYLK